MSLIIIGGGEHSRVVEATAKAIGLDVLGFADPVPRGSLKMYLGNDEMIEDHPDCDLAFGLTPIGNKGIITDLPQRYWPAIIHPTATVLADIKAGVQVMAHAHVGVGSLIGEHTLINTGAIIEHDCTIGSFCHIAPGAILGGGVKIGNNCFVGMGAIIKDHVTIRDGTRIRMGEIVTRDI